MLSIFKRFIEELKADASASLEYQTNIIHRKVEQVSAGTKVGSFVLIAEFIGSTCGVPGIGAALAAVISLFVRTNNESVATKQE